MNVKRIIRIIAAIAVVFMLACGLSACKSKADTASENISKAADNFEINRRIIFYNGITGQYMLTIEGRCSLGNYDPSSVLTVTCKVNPSSDPTEAYRKYFLGLSDNVTYMVEQTSDAHVSSYHTAIYFRPSTILPDPKIDTDQSVTIQDGGSSGGSIKTQEPGANQ